MYQKATGETLPFLSTHLGNIARNRELGLRFLSANPQRQHGMSGVSEISMLVDRLRIARWMILIFLDGEAQHTGHEQEEGEHPWMTIRPFDANTMPMADMGKPFDGSDYDSTLSQIADDLKDVTWELENTDDQRKLIMLGIQLRQCADHLARIVHLCNTSYGIRPDLNPMHMVDVIDRIAPADLNDLMQGMGAMMGPAAFNMSWKDARTHVRIFAERLLGITIEVITPEAIRRDYEPSSSAS